MIAYLDASALVKRYVLEPGSREVEALITASDTLGTGVVSRAEVPAALARALRLGIVTRRTATRALAAFVADWEDLFRVGLTESIAKSAGDLAWEYSLRGYDAVHLATALSWRDDVGEPVVLATYDRVLWRAAEEARLIAWPPDLK